MSDVLLQTKLFIPSIRRTLVPRPRLLSRLDAGRKGKLSLVSAPAGFGKTTLIVHWLQQQEHPATWLSLDEDDDIPLRFFTYLLAAMGKIDPDLGRDLATALRSTSPPDETAVISILLNDLAAHERPFILVLDDYHLITSETIHAALAFFIDHLPPWLHLVITSREEPPLPLPRWRVRGQLTEIRAADLRFTLAEAAQFLKETMGLSLTDTAVADLESRTEGWVAGLQLAALSLRKNQDAERFIAEFVGSERQVADYLLQEVLWQQADDIQQFLLDTAVLERFNAALCDALLEQENSQDILDELEQNNLFIIPLDHSRRWYRYHHLFAQLLRYRLERDWPKTAVAELHRRAHRWYHQHGLLEEAIAHAFQIPDHDAVAQLIETIPLHYLYEDGGGLRIRRWIKQLPQGLVSTRPYLAVMMTGAAMITGDVQTAYTYLDLFAGEKTLQAYEDLFRSILVRNESGDHQQALRLAQQALAPDEEDEGILSSLAWQQMATNLFSLGRMEEADEAIDEMRRSIHGQGLAALNMRLHALEMQVRSAYIQGDLDKMSRLCRLGIDLATPDQKPGTPLIGVMFAWLGILHYQRNELQKAERYVKKALAWGRRSGISDLFTYSAGTWASLACRRGDRQALQAALALYTSHLRGDKLKRTRDEVAQISAWFWLKIGDLDTAVHWADRSGLTLDDDPAFPDFDAYYTLLAIRLAQDRQAGDQKRGTEMLVLIDKLKRHAQDAHSVISLVNTLILKALILDFLDDPTAVTILADALDLARPGQMMRPFLDWGTPLQRLLQRTDSPHRVYVERLTAAFAAEGVMATPEPATTGKPPIHLTPREDQILHLIAAGLSNKQIEEKLFITNNTVRTHIKNLYSKLQVKSRTQAIKRAGELNLLQ